MSKNFYFVLLTCLFLWGCSVSKNFAFYKSDTLKIEQISDHTFIHTSFLATENFGMVPCNGLIVIANGEAVVLDTPVSNNDSKELLDWISTELNCKTVAVVATHFHVDCLGGLHYFHEKGIPSYSTDKTIVFAKENGLEVPNSGFNRQTVINVGNEQVFCTYLGEGHTKDNSVGYFAKDKVLFGGCLIKEIGAGLGNLEDANTATWSATVRTLKSTYKKAKIIVPGHGKYGGQELLDYTIDLFDTFE